jgi:hypothetical protein
MGLDFLTNNGGRRIRDYAPLPLLLSDGLVQFNDAEQVDEGIAIDLNREVFCDKWQPRDVTGTSIPSDWAYRPTRFVDGKDTGRTVAWLQSQEGYPVPVRLSEIGAVVMRNIDGDLRREFERVERVVSLIVDLFPWDEVESFARALQRNGFRLLPCQKPLSDANIPNQDLMFDFERMRKTTQNRSMDEMTRLEKRALAQANDIPTIVDGRLEPRIGAFDRYDPVVGLIKTLKSIQLHREGWQLFYNLRPGQRTPAFQINGSQLSVISWYLRLDGQRGELPNWGIVRLEISQQFFDDTLAGDWSYIDCLSRLVCDYRCKDSGYSRSAVSISPIQRAEQSLGALFTQSDMLINRFYRLTGLQ